MSRQILTLFIVFGGVLLLLRSCNQESAVPAALPVESFRVEADATGRVVLEDKAKELAITLSNDGTIVSVREGKRWILREVNPERRVLHMLERMEGGATRYLPRKDWAAKKIENGYEFTLVRGSNEIRRVVRLADGGIDCEVAVKGASDKVHGFEMTAISGVALDTGVGATPPDTFITQQLAGSKTQPTGWTTLIEGQERARAEYRQRVQADPDTAGNPDYSARYAPRADQSFAQLGVLGADYYVTLTDVPSVSAVNTIAYKLRRASADTREIERWLSLPSAGHGYSGSFRLRWTPRAKAAQGDEGLAEFLSGRKETRTILENETLRLEMSDRGAAITSMWLRQYVRIAGQANLPENWVPMIRDVVRPGRRTLTMLVQDAARFGADPADAIWTLAERTKESLTYRLETEGWKFEKTITLPAEDRYDLGVEIRVTRPDGVADSNIRYSLIGAAGSYIADAKRGVAFTEPAQGFFLEGEDGENEVINIDDVIDGETLERGYGTDTAHMMRAIGVRGAFFVCVLVTPGADSGKRDTAPEVLRATVRPLKLAQPVAYLDETETYETGLEARISARQPFAPNGVATTSLTLYAGPNELSRLRPLGIGEAVDFGMFALIARSLMWLMKALEGLFGSYGVAIVVMTLIVRATLLPVSYKSQLSVQRYSKRMQKLKPMLEALEEKYGKNRQRLNQERMKVMRENKVGFPLGCLMMFVQIPIWIALFRALRVEFSLRHEPFLWASDLMLPDQLFGLPFFPDYFNLLPILMLALWVTQQKLSPQAMSDDPQVQAQMKMVKFMPYVFFFMLYTYASALSVYMCISSAWGIAEAKLVRRAITKLDG